MDLLAVSQVVDLLVVSQVDLLVVFQVADLLVVIREHFLVRPAGRRVAILRALSAAQAV